MNFTDKVVLVTGASRGIGRAIAEAFVAQGAKVVGTATSQSGADAISAYLGDAGCGLPLNVTSAESVDALFDAIKAKFGEVDILISAQVAGGVVLRAVKAVAAHDRALEAERRIFEENKDA